MRLADYRSERWTESPVGTQSKLSVGTPVPTTLVNQRLKFRLISTNLTGGSSTQQGGSNNVT
jgi:hypothetical protein